jgi:hypothetical protein
VPQFLGAEVGDGTLNVDLKQLVSEGDRAPPSRRVAEGIGVATAEGERP